MKHPWDFPTVAEARRVLSYEEFRAWWAWVLENPYPKSWKSKRVKPIPGVLDVVDDEAG